MHQRFGADSCSLDSATGYKSLAENPLKLGQTSSAEALKLIIRRTRRRGNTELKSYHGLVTDKVIYENRRCGIQSTYYVTRF